MSAPTDMRRYLDIITENFKHVWYTHQDYPNNDDSTNSRAALQEIKAFINKHCQPWLKAIDNNLQDYVVYRGTKSFPPSDVPENHINAAWVRTVRTDRIPVDSSAEDTRIYDILLDIVNSDARRNNSVFVSGSLATAMAYGPAHVVIPIGDFDIAWSSQMRDWYHAIRDERVFIKDFFYPADQIPETDEFAKLHNSITSTPISREEALHQILKFYPQKITRSMIDPNKVKKVVHTNNIKQAIEKKVEIMISAKEALYINRHLYQTITY